MQQPIITLTSDWRQEDYYAGSLKGRIYTLCPQAVVVDINHHIPPFNITQAAFIIQNSYIHFPPGSIHLVAVNTEPGNGQGYLCAQYHGHYFVSADNGFFSLLFSDEIPPIRSIPKPETPSSFSSLEVYSQVAAHLYNGGSFDTLGTPAGETVRNTPIRPAVESSSISGRVIHIDSYKNAITNISKDLFEEIRQERKFEIYVQSRQYRLTQIHQAYDQVSSGDLLVLFNSLNLLEVAIRNGNASDLLNLTTDSSILIKFQ